MATPIMSPDEERFMAFEGLVQWTRAVVTQSARVSAARDRLSGTTSTRAQRHDATLDFHSECHFFAVASHKLLEFKEWALSLELFSSVDFSEIDSFSPQDIRDLRDMREHVVDYFSGKGRRPNRWIFKTPDGARADASSVGGTLLGGRLDWVAFGEAAKRLLQRLLAEPIPHPSIPNMPPPPKPALPVRLFRSLHVMTGGDQTAAHAWLTSPNAELGGIPAEKMQTVEGLTKVVAYLEARFRS